MRAVKLLPAAGIEIAEAREWYEGIHIGLGDRFVTEVRHQLDSIADHPERFQIVRRGARCGRLRVFPYIIVFREELDEIFVLACMHTRRNPMMWQGRI